MIAIAVNALTILIGSAIGLLVKNSIGKRMTDAIMLGIGLFTVYTGITGLTTENNGILYLLAIVLGGMLGTALKLEDRINSGAEKFQKKFAGNDTENRFASGLTGFFIVSCVGAFTIVASFNASSGDSTMLYTKAIMDLVVSMAMASSLGIGVMFAVIPTVLYESLLVLFAGALMPILSESMMDAVSCMGAILTIAIGTNVSGITKFKVVDYIPSLLLAPLFVFLAEYLGIF